MKKIIVFILSISILIIGTFSVAALATNTEDSLNTTNENIMIQPGDAELDKPINIEKLNTQKETIFNNILNCIDYYDTVSGTFETTFIDGSPVTVSYDVNIPEQISTQTVKGQYIDLSILCQDETILQANNINKHYFSDRFISQYDATSRKKQTETIDEEVSLQAYYNYEHIDVSSERVRKNAAGEMEYYFRPDLTNADMASISINPQNLAFGFMSEFNAWSVVATDKCLNRQVLVIAGKTANSDYAEKLKVDVFEMRFDVKTGILLDFKGYLSDGTLTQYLTTSELTIEETNIGLNKEISDNISLIKSKYEEIR